MFLSYYSVNFKETLNPYGKTFNCDSYLAIEKHGWFHDVHVIVGRWIFWSLPAHVKIINHADAE